MASQMNHSDHRMSYCLKVLERIHVTDRVINRTEKLIEDTQVKLEHLLGGMETERHLRDRIQENETRIKLLTRQLEQLRDDLSDKQRIADTNNRLIQDSSDDMDVLREQMRCDYKCLEEKKNSLADEKKKLFSSNYALLMRRNQLITELYQIYPIQHSQGKYFICNIHLPDSEDFKGRNMLDLSVALGYVSHFLIMTSRFLDIPLRYCLVYYGSHSSIIDHIDPCLDRSQRIFPLHCQTGSKDRKIAFNYAVYLMNKNISQLRHYLSLKTNDPRATLPNLYTLVEERCKITATG